MPIAMPDVWGEVKHSQQMFHHNLCKQKEKTENPMERKTYHCAGIVIYRINQESEEYEVCLVQSIKFRQQETGASLYIIPGGKVEEIDYQNLSLDDPEREGKAVLACAKRETKEEVNLDLENIVLLGTKTKTGKDMGYKDPNAMFILYDFCAEGKGTLKAGEELLHAEWCAFDGLPEPMELYLRQLIEKVYHTHINPVKK